MKLAWIACGCLAAACLSSAWQQAPVPTQAVPQAPGRGIIEGQVVNAATGLPLKRATVRIVGIGRRPESGMPNMFNKETDEQGRFSFSGLDSGRYQVSAERQGYLRQSYGARKYSGGGTPLILSADQSVRDVLFKLSPQSVITGKVLDEDGEPVANVQVRALKYAYRGGKKQWAQTGNGQTSDIGEFRIPNLEPARYIVSANPVNRGQMMQTASNEPLPETPEMIFAPTYYPSTTDQVSAVPIDLAAGSEMRGIDIRLRRTRVFRVRGTLAGMTGPGGRGQVNVMLSPKEGPQGPQPSSPARPPDNRFEIRGVAPGSYMLYTQPRGQNQPMAFMPIEVAGNHLDNVVLSVVPGVDIPGSIKIEDATAPLETPNLTVNLQPAFPMGGTPRAKAGEGLNFKLTNVMPVKYRVSVSGLPEGCFVKSIQYGGLDVPDDGIEMMSSAPIQITVSATAGEVLAAVVDKDGKPVPNALVALIPKDGKAIRANSSDEAGAVNFRSIKPGDYRIMAFEDIPQGAHQDPEFVKPFEGSAASISLEPRGRQAVQVKVIAASETDK